jgi:Ca-activated chloride channel family protein
MEYRYARWDPEKLRRLASHEDLLKLFHYLLLQTGGDVEEALRFLEHLQSRGYLPADWNLKEFKKRLEDEDYVRQDPRGRRQLTAKSEKRIRAQALERIFGGLRSGGRGTHATPYAGQGTSEPLPERREYRFGDDLGRIDFQESLKNSLRRHEEMQLGEDDLSVCETEAGASCATVLLLDVSHSMVLYGEDRITPAKQVALALVELITRQYPKDSLRIVLFGDTATEVQISDLPYVGAGPYHTNTKAGLQMARALLQREKHPNKQIVMITDGKPSVIDRPGGRVYRNPVGLDPVIVNRTLDEAVVCRRRRIPITTFMITSDPYLREFVARLTELNRGRAYFTSPDRLGEFVLWDFVSRRRRNLR